MICRLFLDWYLDYFSDGLRWWELKYGCCNIICCGISSLRTVYREPTAVLTTVY